MEILGLENYSQLRQISQKENSTVFLGYNKSGNEDHVIKVLHVLNLNNLDNILNKIFVHIQLGHHKNVVNLLGRRILFEPNHLNASLAKVHLFFKPLDSNLVEQIQERSKQDKIFSRDEIVSMGLNLLDGITHLSLHGCWCRTIVPSDIYWDEHTRVYKISPSYGEGDTSDTNGSKNGHSPSKSNGAKDETSKNGISLYSLALTLIRAATLNTSINSVEEEINKIGQSYDSRLQEILQKMVDTRGGASDKLSQYASFRQLLYAGNYSSSQSSLILSRAGSKKRWWRRNLGEE
jgi:serine/threonine protein kinase